ncbi:MAG TPA: phage major capsid protein [Phycisphaerales bacterium]|nr:phage major capsid protein [Phycisphaerales bacterium]
MYLQELREKAGKAVADARAIKDAADNEKRAMTSEEETRFDKFMADYDETWTKIQAAEKTEARSKRLEVAGRNIEERKGRQTQPEDPADVRGRRAGDTGDVVIEYGGAELRFARGTATERRCKSEYLEDFRQALRGAEARTLQSSIDVNGGYLVTPEVMIEGILKELDDEVHIRRLSRKVPVPGATSVGIRTRTSKASTFRRGSELSDSTDDTALKFGKKVLTPTYVTGSILVSRDLMRSANYDPMQIIREELARDAGELEEREFLTGNGAGEPMGLFTASADGISTARDVDTGNTQTEIRWDGLMEAHDSLKARYQAVAQWMFHRTTVTKLRKQKDGNGQYLWQPSTRDGVPSTILGKPYIASEWVPSTFTAGQYVGIIGDFSHYVISDALEFELLVLDQTKARQNLIEVVVRRKYDAMPDLAEAFARVKLAA